MGSIGRKYGRRIGGALTALVGASLTLALLAGPALAAAPIDLGLADGTGPGLAITASGSAALSFTAAEALNYCRVDPGAVACSSTHAFTNPNPAMNEDIGNWPLAEGNTVRVIEARRQGGAAEAKYLWSGEPFGTSTTLGTGGVGTTLYFHEAVEAPIGSINPTSPIIVTIANGTNSSGGPTVAASTTAAGSGNGSAFALTKDDTGDSTLSVQGSMLSGAYVSQTHDNQVFWRRYSSSASTPTAIETDANWSIPVAIGTAGANPEIRMATGPSGLFVAYANTGGVLVAQQFNGIGFNAPFALTSAGGVGEFAIAEDPAGVLHVAWRDESGAHYRYAKDASNTVFSNPQALPGSDYRDMRVAFSASGNGWLSWWDDDTEHDFVLALAPGEPGTPAPPTTGGGGAPAPAPSSGKPKSSTAGPKIVIFGALGHGLVGSLTVPKQCVPGGDVFKAKVAVKRKGSKAHKASYTVKQVAFLLGTKKISTDRAKPFEVGFATKGVGADKALSVAARITVNLRAKHHLSTVTKTLKTTVRTCK
jgi:hypothetical protein